METLWRTGLLCTVIAIVFATEVEGGRRDEFVQSQGECRRRGGGGGPHERVRQEPRALGKRPLVCLLASHAHPKRPIFPAKRGRAPARCPALVWSLKSGRVPRAALKNPPRIRRERACASEIAPACLWAVFRNSWENNRFGWFSALGFWEQPYLFTSTQAAQHNLVVWTPALVGPYQPVFRGSGS